MYKDPIVEEVRRIREQLAAECNYDIHLIFEREKEFARHWKGKLVGKEDIHRTPASGAFLPLKQAGK